MLVSRSWKFRYFIRPIADNVGWEAFKNDLFSTSNHKLPPHYDLCTMLPHTITHMHKIRTPWPLSLLGWVHFIWGWFVSQFKRCQHLIFTLENIRKCLVFCNINCLSSFNNVNIKHRGPNCYVVSADRERISTVWFSFSLLTVRFLLKMEGTQSAITNDCTPPPY